MSLFSPLPATTEGVGPYRINRYRIYFRPVTAEQENSGFVHNRPGAQICADLANQFKANFPRYFNPNAANVESRAEQYKQRNTLRFLLNARLFGVDNVLADLAAPDLHADWVGVHRDHARGFTVQTLKRNFTTGLDWAMLGTNAAGGAAAGAVGGSLVPGVGTGAGAVVGLGGGTVAGIIGFNINKYHFLAGRRSWVFGTKQEFGRHGVDSYDAIPDDALAFETAAVERLSGRIFQAAAASRLLGDFDRSIHSVWCTLMNNFLGVTGFRPVDARVWGHREGVVSYCEPSPLETLQACQANGEYAELVRHHQQMLPT